MDVDAEVTIMAEFMSKDEKAVGVGEPIVFENNTNSPILVGMAVMFREAGEYHVSVTKNRVVVTKE